MDPGCHEGAACDCDPLDCPDFQDTDGDGECDGACDGECDGNCDDCGGCNHGCDCDPLDCPEFQDTIRTNYIETIFLTSPLHDIGKVGIPDFVLLKPGRLTDDEFDLMKLHTTIGGDTLGAAAAEYPGVEYLRMATDIARCHHERFNGSGYPAGLSGTDIPLCARIVALADVYDALISKRVYKAAMPHDVARKIIVEERGEHFDPDVVDAFLATEGQFIDCCERFAEPVAAAVGD
jgi:putative two-component system response regulator